MEITNPITALDERLKKKPVSIFVGGFLLMNLDACVSEAHGSTVTVTEHPVEDGSNIADHATVQPLELTLQVIKTNHPMSLLKSLRNGGIGLAAGLLTPGVKTFVNVDSMYTNALAAGAMSAALATLTASESKNENGIPLDVEAYQCFQAVQFNRQVCSIQCELRSYANMLLTSISTTRDAANRESLIASLTFKEIRIVATKTEKIPDEYLQDKKSGSQKEEKKGTVAAKAATPAQSSDVQGSVAWKVGDWLGAWGSK